MMWQYYTREEKESHVQAPPSLLGKSWLSLQYWVFVSWCLQDSALSEVRCLLSMARKFPTSLPYHTRGWFTARALACLLHTVWQASATNYVYRVVMVPLECFTGYLCLPFWPGKWFGRCQLNSATLKCLCVTLLVSFLLSSRLSWSRGSPDLKGSCRKLTVPHFAAK